MTTHEPPNRAKLLGLLILLSIVVYFAYIGIAFGPWRWPMSWPYLITPLLVLYSTVRYWKGYEITHWFLSYFPENRKKAIPYFMKMILKPVSLIFFVLTVLVAKRANADYAARHPDFNPDTTVLDIITPLFFIILLYISVTEVIKNYRLYKAALPQP